MYEHVKTRCKHILRSEQPLQFQSGYYLNKPRTLRHTFMRLWTNGALSAMAYQESSFR